MPYLLDTHTFIWWILDDPRLSVRVRAILQQDNEIFFSIASVWEISIKAQLGRIPFSEDPAVVIPQQIAINGLTILPIEVRHALQVFRLPLLHRDPLRPDAGGSGDDRRPAIVNRRLVYRPVPSVSHLVG